MLCGSGPLEGTLAVACQAASKEGKRARGRVRVPGGGVTPRPVTRRRPLVLGREDGGARLALLIFCEAQQGMSLQWDSNPRPSAY